MTRQVGQPVHAEGSARSLRVGIYLANRAAGLNPMHALRYEQAEAARSPLLSLVFTAQRGSLKRADRHSC